MLSTDFWRAATCKPLWSEDNDAGLPEGADFQTIHQTFMQQLGRFEKMLLDKHEQEVGQLRAENKHLGEQLRAVSRGEAIHLEFDIRGAESGNAKSPRTRGAASSNRKATPPLRSKFNNIEDFEEVFEEAANEQMVQTGEGQPVHHHHINHIVSRKRVIAVEEQTRLQHIVNSRYFELISGMVILLNTALMCMELQYDGLDIGYDLQFPKYTVPATSYWPSAKEVFLGLDFAFNAVFVAELVLRILAMGIPSVKSYWIWFDVCVVSVSAADCFLGAALPVNPGMLRVLRLVRLIRFFKIAKALAAFDSLFLLLKALAASCPAALWSFNLLCAIQLIVGLFLCQILQTFLSNTSEKEVEIAAKHQVFKYFGTFTGSMLTMFEISMANWATVARVLCEDVNEAFMIFFVAYRCFFCFAVLRVIAAIFITETNRVLDHDDELTMMKKTRDRAMFDRKVKRTIRALDTFDGENIGFSELQELANDDEVAALLAPLGFDVLDLEKLFYLIDSASGQVHVDEFLHKLAQMRGPAKNLDMLTMLKIGRRIDGKVQEGFSAEGLLADDSPKQRMEDLIAGRLD